jgi:hypothetical protein
MKQKFASTLWIEFGSAPVFICSVSQFLWQMSDTWKSKWSTVLIKRWKQNWKISIFPLFSNTYTRYLLLPSNLGICSFCDSIYVVVLTSKTKLRRREYWNKNWKIFFYTLTVDYLYFHISLICSRNWGKHGHIGTGANLNSFEQSCYPILICQSLSFAVEWSCGPYHNVLVLL